MSDLFNIQFNPYRDYETNTRVLFKMQCEDRHDRRPAVDVSPCWFQKSYIDCQLFTCWGNIAYILIFVDPI